MEYCAVASKISLAWLHAMNPPCKVAIILVSIEVVVVEMVRKVVLTARLHIRTGVNRQKFNEGKSPL